jgi:hypothetical protein
MPSLACSASAMNRAQCSGQTNPKHDRQAADLVLQRNALAYQRLASEDQRPNGMAASWSGRMRCIGDLHREPAGSTGIEVVCDA